MYYVNQPRTGKAPSRLPYRGRIWEREQEVICSFLPSDGVIVDAGCGGRKLKERFIGLDVVERGEKTHLNMSCNTDVHGSVIEISSYFEPSSVDAVVMNHVTHLFFNPHEDLKKMYREVYKVLKPNGLLVVNDIMYGRWLDHDYSPWPHHFWSCEEYQCFGEHFGFETLSVGDTVENWSTHWAGKKTDEIKGGLPITPHNCLDRSRELSSPCARPLGYLFDIEAWEKGGRDNLWL